MSYCVHLVSLRTMQAVQLATVSAAAGYTRGPESNSVVGLYCSVHDHQGAILMDTHELDNRELNRSNLTWWDDGNAADLYTELTGKQPPADWR